MADPNVDLGDVRDDDPTPINDPPDENADEDELLRLRRDNERQMRERLDNRRHAAAEFRRLNPPNPNSVKFARYTSLSLISAIGLLLYAVRTREQFYLAVLYLGSSKLAYITLGNAAVALTMILFRWVTYTFLNGGLREMERDAVSEGLRWGLTDTCLALTIFREEVTVGMTLMFLTLALSKCLHWSVELRGAHLQQTDAVEADMTAMTANTPPNPNSDAETDAKEAAENLAKQKRRTSERRKRHFGFGSLTFLLLVCDLSAIAHCAVQCAQHGPSVHILFGFEATILFVSAISTLSTYSLHIYDSTFYGSRGKTWHGRGMVTFSLELATEGCKFLFYLIFFTIVFTYYGMPINIFREVWMSYTNLRRRLAAFVKYRRLTYNMNERFADATEEELEGCGRTCIICRETMDQGKKLECGHVFHFYCLREWLQQQQSCPTCRCDIPTDSSAARRNAAANRQQGQGGAQEGDGGAQEVVDAEALAVPNEGDVNNDAAAPANDAGAVSADPPTATNVNRSRLLNSSTPSPASNNNTATVIPASASDTATKTSAFPCLYKVSCQQCTVYPEELFDATTPSFMVPPDRRVIANNVYLCCTDLKWQSLPPSGGQVGYPQSGMMLQVASNGWITEGDVTRIPINLNVLFAGSGGDTSSGDTSSKCDQHDHKATDRADDTRSQNLKSIKTKISQLRKDISSI